MTLRRLEGGYELDDDRSRIDVDAVHEYLAGESYWARGRPRETVERLVREAHRVVGLYHDGRQVGFCRMFTDAVVLAYLADVYVLPEHRGRGLGVELVREMVENGPLREHALAAAHVRRARPLPPLRLRRTRRAADGASPWLSGGRRLPTVALAAAVGDRLRRLVDRRARAPRPVRGAAHDDRRRLLGDHLVQPRRRAGRPCALAARPPPRPPPGGARPERASSRPPRWVARRRWNLPSLIAFRSLQGLGAAFLLVAALPLLGGFARHA